jgi:hypothetical protein
MSIQQNAGSVTPPAGYTNYLGVTSLSSYSVGTGDVFGIRQFIEGFNIADLAWGTASAKTVTLSFWVYSSLTGTFGGAMQNSANNRSYPFTYTISSASTWEYKTVTVAGDTTGTWATNNFPGIQLVFGLGGGSTYSGTAGAWAAAEKYTATGGQSVVGTNGATFYITGVQLEVGSVATPFERRQYGTEFMLCQRYYEIGSSAQLFSGYVVNGEVYYNSVRYAVVKRATPSALTITDVANSGFPAGAATVGVSGSDGFYTQKVCNATRNSGYFQYSWTASSEI